MAELHQTIEDANASEMNASELDGEDVRLEIDSENHACDLPDECGFSCASWPSMKRMTANASLRYDEIAASADQQSWETFANKSQAAPHRTRRTAKHFGFGADWKDRLDDLRDCFARNILRNEKSTRSGRTRRLPCNNCENTQRAWHKTPTMPQRVRKSEPRNSPISNRRTTVHRKSRSRHSKENVGEDVQRSLGSNPRRQTTAARGRARGSKRWATSIEGNAEPIQIWRARSKSSFKPLDNPRSRIDANRIAAFAVVAETAICLPQTRIENRVPADTVSPTAEHFWRANKEMRIRSTRSRHRPKRGRDVQNELKTCNSKTHLISRPCCPPAWNAVHAIQCERSSSFNVPYHGVEQSPLGLAQWMADEVRSRIRVVTQQDGN